MNQHASDTPYFFLSFDAAAFPLAVPRTVLARFLRCLPIHPHTVSTKASYPYNIPKLSLPSHHVGKIVRTLLSASLLNLRSRPIPHQPIMRLELLHHLMAIIYQSEASRLASTELCAETEAGDLVFVGFVELGELLTEFVFGDVGAVLVEDIARGWRDQKRSPCIHDISRW